MFYRSSAETVILQGEAARPKPQHREGEREQETNEANQQSKTRTHTIRPCFQNHTATTHTGKQEHQGQFSHSVLYSFIPRGNSLQVTETCSASQSHNAPQREI